MPGLAAPMVSMEEFLEEAAERQKRCCNLMLFGAPEDDALSENDQLDLDTKLVEELLQAANVPVGVDAVKLERLGKRRHASTSARPMKITLPSNEAVLGVLRNAGTLKKQHRFKDMGVSQDRTPKQAQFYKDLKRQVQHRTQNGEKNLRIRYVRGVPRVVSLNL